MKVGGHGGSGREGISLGTFVISWAQTETDGVANAPSALLRPGAAWSWTGEALRMDGRPDLLRLEGAEGLADLRARAGRKLRRLFGPALADRAEPADLDPEPAQGFAVTDGRALWTLGLVPGAEGGLLVTGHGAPPPQTRPLWVAEVALDRARIALQGPERGVICFTPGTRIATPGGALPVEALRIGDRILTRDSGPQPILWIGQRRMTGARLHAMPALRPIRVKAEALGQGLPQPDLLVSPQHRLLVQGPRARALFNADEVLVQAADLVNDLTIRQDLSLREVTYVHLLLERHEVIWANGLPTESFHPAQAELSLLEPAQAAALAAILPEVMADPAAYGPPARRNLTRSEAAILRHDMQMRIPGGQ